MLEKYFSKALAFLIFLTFDLMLLGAAVRTFNAGLSCPDWPLCFGKVIPEFNVSVYLEFIHRCVAGVVGWIFLGCMITVFVSKKLHHLRWTMAVGLFLLLAQIIMGGLTVLKLLAPGIVTLHLGLAGSFLVSLILAANQLNPPSSETPPRDWQIFKKFKILAAVGFGLICVQILLGAWVASNYAGTVCVDFPMCNGQWFPAWTGSIGAQVIHRLGAYTVATFFTGFFIFALKLHKDKQITARDKVIAGKMFMLVLSQVMIGVLNLKFLIPAWLTVIHLGVAIYLMLTILKLNLRLRQRESPLP